VVVEDALRNIAFPLLRFGAYSSHAFLLGASVFLLLVMRPVLRSLPHWEGQRAVAAERLEGFIRACLLASAVCTALTIVLQAALISEIGDGTITSDSFGSVLETTFGRSLAVRFPMLAALAVLLVGRIRTWAMPGAGSEDSPSPIWWGGWILLSAGLMLTNTFSGHATGATPKWLSMGNDGLHLVSGGVWFGGVILMAVLLPTLWRGRDKADRLRVLAPSISHFSMVALVSIGIVTVTGVINSLLHVGTISDLWDSPYGQALSIKLLLFMGILVLGASNHFVVKQKLNLALGTMDVTTDSAGGTEAVAATAAERKLFRRAIGAELVIAVAIMAATGVLTNLARTA
jgi:putative copper export protein